MKKMYSLFILILLGSFFVGPKVQAAVELVKSKDFSTVYYIDETGTRHPFPNNATYRSWYGSDFSKVVTVGNDFLANYRMGKNITIHPGTYLVKVRTASAVYAVEPGGVLRQIENESIAESIYGQNWAKRVVDVPDVFFDNYTLGSIIDKETEIPDGILFKQSTTGKYYYKNKDLLQPFETAGAVAANKFDLNFAVSSDLEYLFAQRFRPISGFDKNIFNLIVKPKVDSRDCESKRVKTAVIFLTTSDINANELQNVEKIKSEIAGRYQWASYELSEIDLSYPIVTIKADDYITSLRNDGTREIKSEVINTFFDEHSDVFDFIIIWTNFKIPSENTNEIASFTYVNNRVHGINRDSLSWSKQYGTGGKLKGVIVMGNINKYQPDTTTGLNEALNLVNHEILHQWAAYVNFIDASSRTSQALLREKDYEHWSYYAGFLSPLGGSGWIDNGDGTFTSQLSQMADGNLRRFSQLDLYLMGLIPYQVTSPVFYVEPATAGTVGNTITGKAVWVTVDQIIAAHGKVECNQY